MKTGDLAVIIKCPTQPLNIGVIVTLVDREPDGPWLCEGNVKPAPGGRALGREVPYKLTRVPAAYLRPINGGEGEDEILRIAGKPVKEQA